MLELKKTVVTQGTFHIQLPDLAFDPGVTAIMGPSGAGKSTVLAAIGGFIALRQRSLFWDGVDISQYPPSKRPMAVLFQDNNLFPHLSLFRNVALAVSSKTRLPAPQAELVEQALSRVGLAGMGERRPSDVSGGQQSRAALARVLLQDKPIVLLDEPFSALGPAMKQDMLDLLADLTAERGATVIMVTHDPNDAKRIAHKISVVDRGTATPPMPTETALATGGPLAGYLSG